MTEFHPGRKPAYSKLHAFKAGGSMDRALVLQKWATEMPRLAMSRFIAGKDVFVPLVSALKAPGSGFTVTAQEQTATQGRWYRSLLPNSGHLH